MKKHRGLTYPVNSTEAQSCNLKMQTDYRLNLVLPSMFKSTKECKFDRVTSKREHDKVNVECTIYTVLSLDILPEILMWNFNKKNL